jgi:hypothetical protein
MEVTGIGDDQTDIGHGDLRSSGVFGKTIGAKRSPDTFSVHHGLHSIKSVDRDRGTPRGVAAASVSVR